MSGRQQHYLPQFLQRNFHSRKSGIEYYVHAHKKASTFQPNTGSIGLQRDFYGHPETSQADANITRAETLLGDVVIRLTSGNDSAVTQDELALLVASLSLRTKKMREALKDASPRIVAALAEAANATNLAGQQFDEFFADKKQVDGLIDAEMSKVPHLGRNQMAKFRANARSLVAHQARVRRDSLVSDIQSQFDAVMAKLIDEASGIADGAFLKLFADSTTPDKRAVMFKGFHYSLVEAPDGGGFILGDCAVVAMQSDGKPKLALGNIDDELALSEVWLPLSPRLAVVGLRAGRTSSLSVVEVNRMSAMLSHEFFITDSPPSKDTSALQALIGRAEPLLTPSELAAMSEHTQS